MTMFLSYESEPPRLGFFCRHSPLIFLDTTIGPFAQRPTPEAIADNGKLTLFVEGNFRLKIEQ